MDKFKDRLKMAIKDESVNAFANRAGLSEGVIRNYLSGPTLPGLENLIAIANAANVNIKWLATGEGPKTHTRINMDFLAFLLAIFARYEEELGTPLSYTEKAFFISTIYDLYWQDGFEFKGLGELIKGEIEALHISIKMRRNLIDSGIDEIRRDEITRDSLDQLFGKDDADIVMQKLLQRSTFKAIPKKKK